MNKNMILFSVLIFFLFFGSYSLRGDDKPGPQEFRGGKEDLPMKWDPVCIHNKSAAELGIYVSTNNQSWSFQVLKVNEDAIFGADPESRNVFFRMYNGRRWLNYILQSGERYVLIFDNNNQEYNLLEINR
jgi:hypothetical protein